MRLFSVIFFCAILSICNLEMISNENHIWQANDDGMVPVENINPLTGYQNFKDNNAEVELRNSRTQSCLNHAHSEDKQLENTIVSPATRRSANSEAQKSSLPKAESHNIQNHGAVFDENKLKSISNKDALASPQSFNNANTQTFDPSPENNSISREGFVVDNIDDDAPLFDDTVSEENEISRNQESVAPIEIDESDNFDLGEPENQFVNPRMGNLEHSTNEKKIIGCTDKNEFQQMPSINSKNTNEFDSIPKPPRRLLPATTSMSNVEQKILNRNNDLATNNDKRNYLNSNPNNNAGKQLPNEKNVVLILNDSSSSNNKNSDKFSQPTDKHLGRSGLPYTSHNYKLNDPAQGVGISQINKSAKMKLLNFDRVCYACSSVNNPTCLSPDRKTTVKYCRKGVNACVTKTFGSDNSLTLIRDCGKTCDDSEIPGLVPKYKTCSICHTDLCNGSYSINVSSVILASPTIVLIVVTKPLSIFS